MDNEVINNDSTTETEPVDVLNKTSQITESANTNEESTDTKISLIDRDTFDSAVSDYFIDQELYSIKMIWTYGAKSEEWEFVVPKEHCEDIRVIDGMIYNLGSETIRLSSTKTKTDWSATDAYYYIIEVPVYGSEEYYKCLSESYETNHNGSYPQPYNFYHITNVDGYLESYEMSVFESNRIRFETSGTPMLAWSLETIFLFIILILLIGRSVFRKG